MIKPDITWLWCAPFTFKSGTITEALPWCLSAESISLRNSPTLSTGGEKQPSSSKSHGTSLPYKQVKSLTYFLYDFKNPWYYWLNKVSSPSISLDNVLLPFLQSSSVFFTSNSDPSSSHRPVLLPCAPSSLSLTLIFTCPFQSHFNERVQAGSPITRRHALCCFWHF